MQRVLFVFVKFSDDISSNQIDKAWMCDLPTFVTGIPSASGITVTLRFSCFSCFLPALFSCFAARYGTGARGSKGSKSEREHWQEQMQC